jgi:hypothetical protein
MDMGRGVSGAQLLLYDDGIQRVTKFFSGNVPHVAMANEVIASRIADLLGVPCPRATPVLVPNAIVLHEQELRRRGFSHGLHLGSEYLPSVGDGDAATLASIANKEALAKIVVFDAWCNNGDRRVQDQMIYVSVTGQIWAMSIDHGHCFGQQWTTAITSETHNVTVRFPVEFQPHLAVLDTAFSATLSVLTAITRAEIEQCVDAVPDEWLDAAHKDAMKKYLIGRVPDVALSISAQFTQGVQP